MFVPMRKASAKGPVEIFGDLQRGVEFFSPEVAGVPHADMSRSL